jgi:predicted dehydrogenase
VRANRDELVEFQIDGTRGSAVARATRLQDQPRERTPRPGLDPVVPNPIDLAADWTEVPDEPVDNELLVQWEQFLRQVVGGEPFPYGFLSGAKGVRVAQAGLKSWREKRYIDIPKLVVEAVAV